jgi:hypothetical protein
MTALMRWDDVRDGLFEVRLETPDPDVERRGGERPDWDRARPGEELPEIPGYDPPHEDDYRPDES